MRILPAFASLFALFLFFACKKDHSLEGGLYRHCSSCTYLPLCDSETFVYVDSNALAIDTLSGVVHIGSDTVINGLNYTRVSGLAVFHSGLIYNCDNQDYKTLLPLSTLGITDSIVQQWLQQLPFPVSPAQLLLPSTIRTSFLKAALPAGASWTDTIYQLSLPPLFRIFAGLDATVAEKGIRRTEFQHTYDQVIHVTQQLRVTSAAGNLPVPDMSLDYYFAPGAGLIELRIR